MARGRRGSQFEEENQAGAGKKNPRLTRADVLPYRARYIAGEAIEDQIDGDGVLKQRGLGRDLLEEFGWDTYEHACHALKRRCAAENWVFLRERHQEYVAERILAEAGTGAVERWNGRMKAASTFMVELGLEALTRISPDSVTEAVLLFREGRETGYRALGEPDRLTRNDVNLGGTLSVEHNHAYSLQELDSDDYKIAARARLAELAATLDGPRPAEGRDEPGGTE